MPAPIMLMRNLRTATENEGLIRAYFKQITQTETDDVRILKKRSRRVYIYNAANRWVITHYKRVITPDILPTIRNQYSGDWADSTEKDDTSINLDVDVVTDMIPVYEYIQSLGVNMPNLPNHKKKAMFPFNVRQMTYIALWVYAAHIRELHPGLQPDYALTVQE